MPKVPYNKRKDGRYYKQIVIGQTKDGKKKVKTINSRKGERWQDFDKRVRAFMLGIDQGNVIQDEITLGECIDLWWDTKIDLSAGTIKTYKSNLKRISHLNHLKLKDIKPIHFQSLYNELYKENARNLIQKMPSLINNILNFAVINNFVAENVNKKVNVPKIKNKKRRALTEEEKKAILKAFDIFTPFEKAFVGLLYYTGMRRGEILALRKDDIFFDKNYISVSRTITIDLDYKPIEKDGTKTPAGVRKIPIVEELRNILTEYINNSCKGDYLFLTRKGNFYDSATIRWYWERILDKINKYLPEEKATDISPHYFRHNFATELAYSNIPVKTTQYIMGHEHINITMDIYADVKLNMEDTINALEKHWKD